MSYFNKTYSDFSVLEGLVISSITGTNDDSNHVVINTECGRTFHMRHEQDCCESVNITDVNGCADNVTTAPVYNAYKSTTDISGNGDAGTRTEFGIHTAYGSMYITWKGYSNGYYGTGVSFYEITDAGDESEEY